MFNRNRCLVALGFALTMVTFCKSLQAQTLVRDDIPAVTITGDSAIVDTNGDFTDNGQILVEQHRIAQQQVEFALDFLLSAKSDILSGNSEGFNRFFGDFYVRNNRFAGQYNQTTRTVSLLPTPLAGTITVEEDFPFDVVGAGTAFLSQVRPGDLIYIHRFGYRPGTQPRGGFLREVAAVGSNELLRVGINWTPGRGRVDPQAGNPLPEIMEDNARLVSLVILGNIRSDAKLNESIQNRIHYDRVVATFRALRNNLAGTVRYEGTLANAGTAAFQGQYPNNPGTALFGNSASGTRSGTIEEFNGLSGGPAFANRAFRQDGYSNSRSLENGRNGNVPWSSDDGLGDPLVYSQSGAGNTNRNPPTTATATNDWFNNFMTIWGDNRNPSIQNVGPSFFSGTRSFAGDFFNQAFSGSTNRESLPPMWQMIIESFAEQDNQFGDRFFVIDGIADGTPVPSGTAFVGVQEFINRFFTDPDGNVGSADFFEARDAGNYAQFAALFNDAIAGGLPTNPEPRSKRVTAGFAPVVPETQWGFNFFVVDPDAGGGGGPMPMP